MTRALIFTGPAQTDLEEIFDFIAADNPRRARTYIEDIRRACRNLCHTPLIGIEWPDLRPGLRNSAPLETRRRCLRIAA